MNCPVCNKSNLKQKYKYEKRNEKFLDNNQFINFNNKILTCEDCDLSFNSDVSIKDLDHFYSKINIIDKQKKIIRQKFSEFNSRFFSQVLYYLQFFKIKKNCSILEIGPNRYGISKTIKIFEKEINYYYFDAATIEPENKVVKLGDYYYPLKSKLPKLDLIWMSHSLEHLHPELLVATFRHFHESLDNDGKIFIEIPDELNPLLKIIIPHTLFFTKQSIYKVFDKLGFSISSYTEINNKNEKDNLIENNFNDSFKKNKFDLKKNYFVQAVYLFVQKLVPDKIVKKYVLKNFIKNGPYTNEKIIRIILKKK
ncbi:hypothetical protein [Candidatus Pelagibacter sp. Uisw_130]|uniref:hypothetical protein n=1 Tax=Candidatus Pelagibacter sp. Uisw_130 TaxID=3230989 RepID=UPI0039ED9A19